jgi:hypothetical protein
MSDTLSVTGGPAGIEATTEDLLLAARLVDRLADEVEDALRSGLPSIWVFGPWDQFAPFGAEVTAVHREVLAPSSAGPTAVARCRDLRTKLLAAAERYRHADDANVAELLGFGMLAGLGAGRSLLGGLAHFAATGNPVTSAEQILISDPALVDAAMTGSGALSLDVLIAPHYPDGFPVVTATGVTQDVPSPRSVADVIGRLAARDAASTIGGAIDVTLVTGPDGVRRAIVDIPGTKTWDPGESSDVTSLGTNARALVGQPTTYAAGVLVALRRAGVRADEPVLLAGHSQGGMVAVEVAEAARATGEFDVTHVVTAGSPIGRTVGRLPATVDLLALENATDVVPHLDAADNPDRPNVTTVGFGAGDGTILGDHLLDPSYEEGARLVDASRALSLRDFEHSLSGFFAGGTAVTHTYTVSRHR